MPVPVLSETLVQLRTMGVISSVPNLLSRTSCPEPPVPNLPGNLLRRVNANLRFPSTITYHGCPRLPTPFQRVWVPSFQECAKKAR